MQHYSPLHPGEFIGQAYLVPLAMTLDEAARALSIDPSSLSHVLEGKSDVTAEMARRLESVFGRSQESWLAMQANYSTQQAHKSIEFGGRHNKQLS